MSAMPTSYSGMPVNESQAMAGAHGASVVCAAICCFNIIHYRAGQALMAETHAEDLAEAIRQAQDAAEEMIRRRVKRLEHDRATSVAIADEAVRAAEQLRQAEIDRKGRGRWARLRAALRGG
jgi:hypothetical protein